MAFLVRAFQLQGRERERRTIGQDFSIVVRFSDCETSKPLIEYKNIANTYFCACFRAVCHLDNEGENKAFVGVDKPCISELPGSEIIGSMNLKCRHRKSSLI